MCIVHITVVHTFLLTNLGMYQTILKKGGERRKPEGSQGLVKVAALSVSESEDTKLHQESFLSEHLK